MAEARLQAELLETKNELEGLRNNMSAGQPTLHKELSMIALIPKWSGTDSSVPLEDFLFSIVSSARIGRWTDADKWEIATLRLTDSARLFFQGCTELHGENGTWETFKAAFRRRYRDVHTDQYHFMRL